MTAELGLNLAGVEKVLALEEDLARARKRVAALEKRIRHAQSEMEVELERVRKSFRAELVPLKHTGALIPIKHVKRFSDPRSQAR